MRRRELIGGASLAGLLIRPVLAQPGPAGGPVGMGFPLAGPEGYGGPGPGPAGGPSLDLNFINGSALDPRIVFTRASAASYFDAAGVLRQAANNVPRFDFDPVTHQPNGLLIEEARTNLLLNSAVLVTQGVTVTAVATTLSFYGTGTVTLSGAFAGSLVGSGAFPVRNSLTFTPTAGTLTATVTGSVLNGQIEAGAFVTSWISTTGVAATRAADVATMPVGSWFTPAAGTIDADFNLTGENPNGYSTMLALGGTNPGTDVIGFYRVQNTGVVNGFIKTTANGTTLAISATPLALGVTAKSAMVYSASSAALALNAAVFPGTVAGALPVITSLILFGSANYQLTLSGYLRRVRYWPRNLSNSELQAATQ